MRPRSTTPTYYYDFVFKLLLVVGVAFVLPVFLVLLNLVGVMSGKAILKGWRVASSSIARLRGARDAGRRRRVDADARDRWSCCSSPPPASRCCSTGVAAKRDARSLAAEAIA